MPLYHLYSINYIRRRFNSNFSRLAGIRAGTGGREIKNVKKVQKNTCFLFCGLLKYTGITHGGGLRAGCRKVGPGDEAPGGKNIFRRRFQWQ